MHPGSCSDPWLGSWTSTWNLIGQDLLLFWWRSELVKTTVLKSTLEPCPCRMWFKLGQDTILQLLWQWQNVEKTQPELWWKFQPQRSYRTGVTACQSQSTFLQKVETKLTKKTQKCCRHLQTPANFAGFCVVWFLAANVGMIFLIIMTESFSVCTYILHVQINTNSHWKTYIYFLWSRILL